MVGKLQRKRYNAGLGCSADLCPCPAAVAGSRLPSLHRKGSGLLFVATVGGGCIDVGVRGKRAPLRERVCGRVREERKRGRESAKEARDRDLEGEKGEWGLCGEDRYGDLSHAPEAPPIRSRRVRAIWRTSGELTVPTPLKPGDRTMARQGGRLLPSPQPDSPPGAAGSRSGGDGCNHWSTTSQNPVC